LRNYLINYKEEGDLKMNIEKTTYHNVSEIEPEDLRLFMINEVGERAMDKLYNQLKDLVQSYPNFGSWFYNIVIPELKLKNGTREIVIALSKIEGHDKSILTGIAILKRNRLEKKICTFRIHDDYRNQGIGTELFEKCFEYLGTRTPIITISEDRKNMFEHHLTNYCFQETERLANYYNQGSIEYVYNGKLTK